MSSCNFRALGVGFGLHLPTKAWGDEKRRVTDRGFGRERSHVVTAPTASRVQWLGRPSSTVEPAGRVGYSLCPLFPRRTYTIP